MDDSSVVLVQGPRDNGAQFSHPAGYGFKGILVIETQELFNMCIGVRYELWYECGVLLTTYFQDADTHLRAEQTDEVYKMLRRSPRGTSRLP